MKVHERERQARLPRLCVGDTVRARPSFGMVCLFGIRSLREPVRKLINFWYRIASSEHHVLALNHNGGRIVLQSHETGMLSAEQPIVRAISTTDTGPKDGAVIRIKDRGLKS